MSEPSSDQRPELHDECKTDLRRGACKTYPITCRDQQELWDSGYLDGLVGRDVAIKRAEAAEAKLAELVSEVPACGVCRRQVWRHAINDALGFDDSHAFMGDAIERAVKCIGGLREAQQRANELPGLSAAFDELRHEHSMLVRRVRMWIEETPNDLAFLGEMLDQHTVKQCDHNEDALVMARELVDEHDGPIEHPDELAEAVASALQAQMERAANGERSCAEAWRKYREIKARLRELVREVRELEREPRMGGPNFTAIMRLVDEYDPKPDGAA